MKKLLSLCLTALMLLSVLTGCGGTADTAEPDGGADAGTETVQTDWNVSSVTGSGTELKFRTGSDQGTYYGFGSVLAQASPPTATTPRSPPWSPTALRTTSSRCR